MVSVEFLGSIALASLRAILQAMTLAAAGFYLGRRKVIPKTGAKLISAISMRVAIPCLLFSRVLPRVNIELVASVWPMLLLPFVNVGFGAFLGWCVCKLTRPKPDFRSGTVAAVALGNSTGLPIVLLSVIQEQIKYLYKNIDRYGAPNTACSIDHASCSQCPVPGAMRCTAFFAPRVPLRKASAPRVVQQSLRAHAHASICV